MTHAVFNLILAVGGGAAVPAAVGAFAFWRVGKQDRALLGWLNPPSTSEKLWNDDTEAGTDDDRIAA